MMTSKLKLTLIFGLILLSVGKKSLAQSGLSIHGYCSQAFAIADGGQIFGVPEDGTTDYRTLALQFRYDIDEYNSSIIQFSHRKIGLSPLMQLEEDVVLDWAFFEHKFNHNIGFKVGKILIPFGLYNEIRDVGILLPFYRPPYSPYTLGSYLSETVNGVSIFYSESFNDYELNVDIYGGNWQFKHWFNIPNLTGEGFYTQLDVSKVDNGLGARLGIYSSKYNMLAGISWQRGDVSGQYLFKLKSFGFFGPQSFNTFNLYLDYNIDWFYVKPELTRIIYNPGEMYIDGHSITSGINIIYGLSLNLSFEMIEINDVPLYEMPNSNNIVKIADSKYLKDYTIGLNYKFSSNVLLKSELHFNKSVAAEQIFINVLSDDPINIKFFILSLATSF